MTNMFISHEVKDFQEWKKVFDSFSGLRASNGEISSLIFRDVSNPNKLTVINKWDTLANAQKFSTSPEIRAAMEKAGVIGHPTVQFLNEV